MNLFMYESIANIENAIRVIDLLPSSSIDDPIEVEIRIVSLGDEDAEYDSLSWCWGPPGDEANLTVNGQSLTCRRGLETALRYLRRSQKVLTLWVDQICINQSDLDEKAQQIQLMKQIYRSATKVRIWLGEGNDQMLEGFAMFEKLVAGHKLSELNDGEPVTKRQMDAYVAFFGCPWFERIWVGQEFVLSKRRLMHFGSASFALEDLTAIEKMSAATIQDMLAHQHDTLSHLFVEGDVDWIQADGKTLGVFIDQARNFHDTYDPATTSKAVVDILSAASVRKATDLRDKVYGCLGLVPTLMPYLDINYNYSVEEVYTLATFALIAHYQGWLYVLCFLAPLQETESEKSTGLSLPSWVCDFTQDLTRLSSTLLFSIFTATGRLSATRQACMENSYLVLTGAPFDEIVVCQPTSTILQDDFIKARSHFDISKQDIIHTTWRSFFAMSESRDERSYVGGGSLEDAYWRTIVCDTIANKVFYNSLQRAEAVDIEHMSEWIFDKNSESLPPFAPLNEKYAFALNYVQTASRLLGFGDRLSNTHLFITRRGYFGHATGRRSVQPGDQVYFLDGGEVPWILRPVSLDIDVNAFEIRSECYVHGIMDGEGLKPPITKESDIDKWTAHELRKEFYGGQDLDTELPVNDYTDIWLV